MESHTAFWRWRWTGRAAAALERSGLRLPAPLPVPMLRYTPLHRAGRLHLNQTPLVVASVQARKTHRERESCTRGAAGRTIEYLEPVHRCRRLTATASMADAARLFLLVAVTAALAGRSGAFVSFAIFLIFSAHAVGFLCNSVSETRLSPPLDALWLVVSGTGRRRVVRVPHGPGGHRAAEDAGLRVRRRRRLQAHPAERRLLRAGHRQGALLLRRQQLLPAQQPEPAGLRLLRHRHALQQRPQ